MPKRLKPDADEAANATPEATSGQHDKTRQNGDLLDLTALGLPPPDRAYQLHLRGYTLREIARELDITKDTANKYVRTLERETAPWRKDARARWRRQAVAKLEHVQSAAWRRWDEVQDPMLLNTVASAEDKIARIRGLYEQELEDGASEVRITISRRGAVNAQVASPLLSGDANGGDADQE